MRVARLIDPGTVYHVISRFVDRRWFFTDDDERQEYLRCFDRAVGRASGWRWLGYALMSNHIHHELVAGDQPFHQLFKAAHARFARWMNERHERIGPLFAERPVAWEVRGGRELQVLAYIHNNPVRAGVATAAIESSWTSHRAYLGLSRAPNHLDIAAGLSLCGLDAMQLDTWISAEPGDDGREEIGGIRRAARKRGALEVGTPMASPTVVPIVARAFARIRPDPRAVLDEVARIMSLERESIASRRSSPPWVSARRVVIHCGLAVGLTISDMATVLGVSRQAGSRIAGRRLTELESALVASARHGLTSVPPSPGKAAERMGSRRRTG
jgi:hypothetical protein